MPVKLLGIDPGYSRCGWGMVVVEGNHLYSPGYGVIETTAHESFAQRLLGLHQQLKKIIKLYAPQETAVEQLFFARNVKTAIEVSQARGVIMLTCCQANVPIEEYQPGEIKLAVTGQGSASKKQVQHMVKILLALSHSPKLDDAADALAVAICHAHMREHRKLCAS